MEHLFDSVDRFTKMIFFCTPNNPVGNVIPLERIREVASRFDGIVVVDEAYIDFTDMPSAVVLQEDCRNVVVLQTLSKAWGLARVTGRNLYGGPGTGDLFKQSETAL